ncbi:hypothetical protein SOVF_089140 isoform B [Spinacia oleracea]|uniref:Ubiquitin carboxyl-terminal hydrolase n=1 Tax=Spinacia oleracea TaxID=3562 RepID=A0ABM3QU96_SPIOL|nr:ubiquitin carboxyl-terminal hydrolase 20 isoform X2 [Spinacia oleracea]KNA16444.1 hypothetical protein SOVF_089140 isoform B [Spinacia oleracea]
MEVEIQPSYILPSHQNLGGFSSTECLQCNESLPKDETPIMETMEIENPISDSPKSDQIPIESSKIQEEPPTPKGDDGQCRKTLAELTLGGEKSKDAEFVQTLDVKEGGKKSEEAKIDETLDMFDIKEGVNGMEDTEFTNILVDSEDASLLDNIDNIVDFEDDDEGGSSPNKAMSGFGAFRGPYGPYHQWGEFDLPNRCMCGNCSECDEDREEINRRNRAMRGPYRNGCYSDPMRRDYHHNRRCRRKNHAFRSNHHNVREREGEMYGIHPYFLYPEPEPCTVGAGLRNLGNTCFLNSIIQCFTHTVPLVQGLLSLKHEASSHGAGEFCVLCAVREQIEHSLGYSGKVVSPSNLVDNMSQISSIFQRHQQEDAHEFLQCLLDKLDSNWSKYEANANDSSSLDDTLVRQIFGGRLVSQVRCCNCGHNSDTYEPLIDLSLEIEDVDSLESALNSFTKVESIEDTEKFTCESCKEQVKVEKQLMLEQAPSVATLHLKRFKSDGIFVEKVDKKVEFPLELNLAPYTKGSNNESGDLKYELFAVVVHVGVSSTSGHYFCYIRTDPDKWYRFDDSQVTMVSEEHVLCQDAYILFYARKGTPWFGSLIENWKEECQQKISSNSPKSVLDDMDLPSTSYSTGKRDEIGDTSTVPGIEIIRQQDEVDTKAGVETGLHYCAVPATELMQDDAQNSAVPNQTSASSSCVPINVGFVEVKEDKFELDVLSLMEENEAIEEDKTCSKNVGDLENDVGIKPSTPIRELSPNIYSDEEPAEAFRISLDHLKIKDKSPSSASPKNSIINPEKQEMKRKEAVKCCKSMPIGRRQMLMAAIHGSRSNDSSTKKRKRPVPIFHGKHSPRKGVKISSKRVLRPVTV